MREKVTSAGCPAEKCVPPVPVQTASLLLRLSLSMNKWLVEVMVCALLAALLTSPLPFLQAVRLESTYQNRTRYMVVVSTNGRQDTEESIVLGMDFSSNDRYSECPGGEVLVFTHIKCRNRCLVSVLQLFQPSLFLRCKIPLLFLKRGST